MVKLPDDSTVIVLKCYVNQLRKHPGYSNYELNAIIIKLRIFSISNRKVFKTKLRYESQKNQ